MAKKKQKTGADSLRRQSAVQDDPVAQYRLQRATEAVGLIRELTRLLTEHRCKTVYAARQIARKLYEQHFVEIDPARMIRRQHPMDKCRIIGRRVSGKLVPATDEDFKKQVAAEYEETVEIHEKLKKKAGRSRKTVTVPSVVEIQTERAKGKPWVTESVDPLDAFYESLEPHEQDLTRWCEQGRQVVEPIVKGVVQDDTIASLRDVANGLAVTPGVDAVVVPDETIKKGRRKRGKTAKQPAKGGRPKKSKEVEKDRRNLLDKWQRAKEAGTLRWQFCANEGIEVSELEKVVNWASQRRRRGAAS